MKGLRSGDEVHLTLTPEELATIEYLVAGALDHGAYYAEDPAEEEGLQRLHQQLQAECARTGAWSALANLPGWGVSIMEGRAWRGYLARSSTDEHLYCTRKKRHAMLFTREGARNVAQTIPARRLEWQGAARELFPRPKGETR